MKSEKSGPDFSMFNSKEVINMRLCLNKLIGCYSQFPDKVEILKEMWKDLSEASADKISEMAEVPVKTVGRKKLIRKRKITLDK